jgi:hypothetical protein
MPLVTLTLSHMNELNKREFPVRVCLVIKHVKTRRESVEACLYGDEFHNI